MSALLQSFFSGPLLTCATFCGFVAAVLPLSWWQGTELDPTVGPPPAEVQTTNDAPSAVVTAEAMERLRRELEQGLAHNSAAITSTLSNVEPALARLQARQLEAVQDLNHALLMGAVIFGTGSLLALIGIALIFARALGRFSELAAHTAARGGHLLPAAPPPTAVALGEGLLPGGAEPGPARVQGAIEQLQKRIFELEHSLQESQALNARQRSELPAAADHLSNGPSLGSASALAALPPGEAFAANPVEASSPASRAAVLLGKGQALLNLDAPEEALACFDEVLGMDSNNAEAFVRKGLAFEKLQNWEEALENYDHAIAADHALTIAYLYKGGVCNRLQRHKEALESYERALQTESKASVH